MNAGLAACLLMVLRPEGCEQISNLGTLLNRGARKAVNHWFIMCHRSRVASARKPPQTNRRRTLHWTTPMLTTMESIHSGKTKILFSALVASSLSLRTATMAYPGFGHLWQQADMSDVEIVLSIVEESAPAGDEAPEAAEAQSSSRIVLQQFPGHSVILSLCPYLVAQASATSLLLTYIIQ